VNYPDHHHPVYFLISALQAIGIRADFARDDRTAGCWGMVFPDFDNRVLIWLIDNRIPHEQAKEDPAARYLLDNGNAIVCHAQKPDADRVGGHWLPLAASPGFEPVKVAKTSDVAFVGYVRDDGRARLLADVGVKFKLSVNQGVFGKQANESYCSAKVGLNIVSHVGHPYAYDSWNMRSPEIMACGIPLVLEYQQYLPFIGVIDPVNCATYDLPGSLFERAGLEINPLFEAIQFAIDHPYLGEAGYELAQKKHTYAHRARQVEQWLTS
jgi:hypothetical protein